MMTTMVMDECLAVEEEQIRHQDAQLKQSTRSASSTMKQSNNMFIKILLLQLMAILFLVSRHLVAGEQTQQARSANFPGVSRDLASFCAARPSLPIDLATMIVHVKKNISFNYKLYLFSADHVFQTGQVIPRDDFRIHSFPVKLKLLNEFWPANVATRQSVGASLENSVPVSSSQFNLKHFLRSVPLYPQIARDLPKPSPKKRKRERSRSSNKINTLRTSSAPELNSDGLPGDTSFISHDVASVIEARYARDRSDHRENLNKHIQFDRDDQLSVAKRFYSAEYLASSGEGRPANAAAHTGELDSDMDEPGEVLSDGVAPQQLASSKLHGEYAADAVVPVGSFSSFHVNETYLVRKDFGQYQAELVRIQVDASQFSVGELLLISNGSSQINSNFNYPQHEDYNFLSHKLLRDPNTRITSINQIYEDWITRNFYTIVYVQRRLEATNDEENDEQLIVNDRLVFRGTSVALLGADQLDYSVKASAFITEKNGLHYYLEFITTGKFYLCAVDWTKRPFKMIDSARFPIKATKTQLDNEELLLCPPAVCYSNQPLDEIVNYGRVSLPERIQKEAQILSKSLFTSATSPVTLFNVKTLSSSSDESDGSPSLTPLNETTLIYNNMQQRQKESIASNRLRARQVSPASQTEPLVDGAISLDSVIEAVKAGSAQLQTRLHLRDWVWTLPRRRRQTSATGNGNGIANGDLSANKTVPTTGANNVANFEWRHELARRNDIKVKPDTYGYVLTGHEIDASYRVYNELYLVSANHLITINYTISNETVISTHPIGDEFLGLSSTLLDPITGAFYDRYANQIYFFKGDRYVGYDYASKKALSEFLLDSPVPIDPMVQSAGYNSDTSNGANSLVSSLPVVGILGRQHQVDGVYHDFFTDLVYIFTGMKFYTFAADEFKNGSFKPEMKGLPKMYCINEKFLHGCNFDVAYKNPCRSDEDMKQAAIKSAKLELEPDSRPNDNNTSSNFDSTNDLNFSDEQQMKLRSIASRAGLLNILVENTLLNKGAARAISPLINGAGAPQSLSPSNGNDSQSQGRIVVYLLMAMIVLTVLVTVAMILVIINWTRVKLANNNRDGGQVTTDERVDSQPGRQYLSNQQHHSRNHQSQYNNNRQTSRSSSIQLDRNVNSKPLKSINVVKTSRRQGSINNSVL